jgi:phytoene dehydrogenase-like protein
VGGARSAELILPGFTHDVCSAIHPLAAVSPVFGSFPLKEFGLQFIEPPAALAHPLNDGTAVLLKRSIAETGATMGIDAKAYETLVAPLVEKWTALLPEILAPLHFPRHPILMARFGFKAMRAAHGLAETHFAGTQAQAIFAGCAAHAGIPLEKLSSAAIGLVLTVLAHTGGWPFVRGGAQKLSDALDAYFFFAWRRDRDEFSR